MKTTLNPFENAKRTVNGTGGGVSPAVIEEMQAEISVLGSQNETQTQDISDIKSSLNSINDNLTANSNPFKFSYDNQNDQYGYTVKVGGADTFFPFKGKTVYWSNPTTGTVDFPAQTITLSAPCNKICIVWGVNNTSINIDAETVTAQYGTPQISGVITLERGQNKNAVTSGKGQRNYAFGSDGKTVTVSASSYQAGYQTPVLIFSLE